MVAAAKQIPATPQGTEILCGCVNMSRTDFAAQIAADPAVAFDTVLDRTGAGRKCTACMLDLEYLFTELPRDATAAKSLADGAAPAPPATSLKRRLYAVLDRIPIMMPLNVTNWMPVFYGGGVEQYLWMANHQLLYDGPGADRDMRVHVQLRDGVGKLVHRDKRLLARDDDFRLNLSAHFPESRDPAVGSVAIDRYASGPMVRGTTRPQIEITCAKSAASLHFQAPAPDQSKSLRMRWRPDMERCFFSIVNSGSRPYQVTFAYRANDDRADQHYGGADCTVPPFGAKLHEVELPSRVAEDLGGGLLRLSWQTQGEGKLHFIVMTRDGERLSIDHL